MADGPPEGRKRRDRDADDDSRADSGGETARSVLRQVLVVGAALVVVVLLLSVSVSALQTQGNCDVVASYPAIAVELTYADGTLSVTHDGGDAFDRHAADRMSVVVERGGDRAEYPLPADWPSLFTAGDTLAVGNVTVGGDPLAAGDRVALRYDTGIDYDWFCFDRSRYTYYADGELAANGTVT